jgi:hypothetical protein
MSWLDALLPIRRLLVAGKPKPYVPDLEFGSELGLVVDESSGVATVDVTGTTDPTASRIPRRDSEGRLAASSFLGAGGIPVERTAYAYGAVGNGTTDDTAALQAAIDSLPNNGGILRIPAGTYRITDTLVIDDDGSNDPGKRGIRIEGDSGGASGFQGAVLYWDVDEPTKPMMRIRSRDTIIEGVQFFALNGTAAICAIDYDTPASLGGQSPTNNALRRVSVKANGTGYVVDGVRIGATNPANLENFLFDECAFEGHTNAGVNIASTSFQSKHHQFFKCQFTGGDYGIALATGSFQAWACDFQSHEEACVRATSPVDHITIGDAMSENCKRFLVAGAFPGSSGGTSCPMLIIGGRHATNELHADGRFIVYTLAGPLSIQGVSFDRDESTHANFKIEAGNNVRTEVVIDSCVLPSGARDVVTSYSGQPVRATYRSAAGTDGSAHVAIPDQTFTIESDVKRKVVEIDGRLLGFFDAAPAARPVVSGARTDALAASLVDALGELGLVQNATRTPLEIFGSDLFIWYTFDAANCAIADTDRIGQVNDLSGNARHATASSTKRPTTTTLADGREAAQFQTAEDRHLILPGAASAYTWMHDGVSGMFAAFCIEIPTGENSSKSLLDNVRGNSGVSGVGVRAALTAGVGCDTQIMKGGAPAHLDNSGAIGTGPTADVPLVVWSAFKSDRDPLLSTEVFGTAVVRTDNAAVGSASSSNPNWPPSLGNLANGGGASLGFAGKMRHFVLVQRLPTADEQEALLHWMNTV